jgi:hypothetical protein
MDEYKLPTLREIKDVFGEKRVGKIFDPFNEMTLEELKRAGERTRECSHFV